MLDLVSGIDKLRAVADATQSDFDRWEFNVFKVLEAQGILHHANKDSSRTGSFDPFDAEKALALALLNLTVDESVTERVGYFLNNPGLFYSEISDNYMGFIEGEKSYQNERDERRMERRAGLTFKKNILEKTITEKEKELVELNDKMIALKKAIEWTYSPEWNDW